MRTIPLKLPQKGEGELLGLLEKRCCEHYGRHQLDVIRPILQKWGRLRREISRASPRAGTDRVLALHRAYLTLCCLLERHFSVSPPSSPRRVAASLASSLPSLWTSSLACPPSRSSLSSSPSASPASSASSVSSGSPGSLSPQKGAKVTPQKAVSNGRSGGPLGHYGLHADFWAFEKACALFNCAACEANAGLFVNRDKIEEFQEALERFLKAGAIFRLLRDTLPSLFSCIAAQNDDDSRSASRANAAGALPAAACPEFSYHALTAYIFMMQAQAQCVSYERALREKLGKRLLSKLAAQVSAFYASALSHLLRVQEQVPRSNSNAATLFTPSLKSVSVGGDRAGSPQQTEAGILAMWLRSQELSYLAAAHFQLSRHEQEHVEMAGEGYGRLVARLRVCREFLIHASELVQKHALKCNLNGLLTHIVATHDQMENDNAMVYLEAVPDRSCLAPLEQACCVELPSLSIQDLQEPDEFAAKQLCQLLPTSIQLKGEEYATRYRSGIHALKQQASDEFSRVSGFLLAHQLPDKLREIALNIDEEKRRQREGREELSVEVPPHLWSQIVAVQAAGGIESYVRQQQLLTQAYLGTQSQLREIEDLLTREEKEDQSFREEVLRQDANESGKTNTHTFLENDETTEDAQLMLLVPASELASQFVMSLDKYRSKAEQAQSANLSLEAKLKQAVSPVSFSSSFSSPSSLVSSPSSALDASPEMGPRRRVSPSSLSMHSALKAASPADLLACLLPRLQAHMRMCQHEPERTHQEAERHAKGREREQTLHAAHTALAELETSVHALQEETQNLHDACDIHAIHGLLLRARSDGEAFDSVLLREEQANLGPAQARIACACKTLRERQEAAAVAWERLEACEESWNYFVQLAKAKANDAVRTEVERVFEKIKTQLSLLLEMQEEQEEGASFFCQLQQFLLVIRRQVEDWRESRSATRQRLRERRHAKNALVTRQPNETTAGRQGDSHETNMRDSVLSGSRRSSRGDTNHVEQSETPLSSLLQGQDMMVQGDKRSRSGSASSPHFPLISHMHYSPAKGWSMRGNTEGAACSPAKNEMMASPGHWSVGFGTGNMEEEVSSEEQAGGDPFDKQLKSAYGFSVFLPPARSQTADCVSQPAFPDHPCASRTCDVDVENSENRALSPVANWTQKDEMEMRLGSSSGKMHGVREGKAREEDENSDEVDMDATTAVGVPFEDERENSEEEKENERADANEEATFFSGSAGVKEGRGVFRFIEKAGGNGDMCAVGGLCGRTG